MTALSAARAGAGLVTLGIASSLNPILESQVLEVMTCPLPEEPAGILGSSAMKAILTLAEGKRCLALGPGLGSEPQTGLLVKGIIENCPIPVVLDADGLNHLAGATELLKKRNAPTVLTPHPGEMARLCSATVNDIQDDRIGWARRFSQENNVHLVLKGARTVMARPDGQVFINPTGNPGMASGGMGDVLTGMIAGFLTQGYPPDTAARLGVYLHGAAADRLAEQVGPTGYLAGDLIARIPAEIGAMISPRYPGLPAADPLAYET
jgi:NAD(P)H-hydrate epimerase